MNIKIGTIILATLLLGLPGAWGIQPQEFFNALEYQRQHELNLDGELAQVGYDSEKIPQNMVKDLPANQFFSPQSTPSSPSSSGQALPVTRGGLAPVLLALSDFPETSNSVPPSPELIPDGDSCFFPDTEPVDGDMVLAPQTNSRKNKSATGAAGSQLPEIPELPDLKLPSLDDLKTHLPMFTPTLGYWRALWIFSGEPALEVAKDLIGSIGAGLITLSPDKIFEKFFNRDNMN